MKELSEEDINELYTYCALNENGKNIVAKINSCEIKEWKKEYKKCFMICTQIPGHIFKLS